MVNINNLFEFCNDSIDCRDVLYSVGSDIGNTLITIAIKNDNNHIYTYSSEWLYLIRCYYPNWEYYPLFINYFYNIINNKQNVEVINAEAISFITSFSRGTVHGYTGLFNIIWEYINNIDIYRNKLILISVDSQQGILDLIYHLCNKNIIDRNKLFFIPKYKTYHFSSIIFFPNRYHIYNEDLANKVSNLISRFIAPDRADRLYYNSLNLPNNLEKICIMKGSNSQNVTSSGVIPQTNIINFANTWGFSIIEPSILNEICLIHCINQCKIFVTTWGTAFLKNYVYISDVCKKIIVLVIGKDFIEQYNSYLNTNSLLLRHKNANIIYRIVDENLNINPNDI